jgi:hypothetical protein
MTPCILMWKPPVGPLGSVVLELTRLGGRLIWGRQSRCAARTSRGLLTRRCHRRRLHRPFSREGIVLSYFADLFDDGAPPAPSAGVPSTHGP